jgi:hypothetical protein
MRVLVRSCEGRRPSVQTRAAIESAPYDLGGINPFAPISCSGPGGIAHVVACNAHRREMQALVASTRKTISPVAMSRYAVSHKPLPSWNRQPR